MFRKRKPDPTPAPLSARFQDEIVEACRWAMTTEDVPEDQLPDISETQLADILGQLRESLGSVVQEMRESTFPGPTRKHDIAEGAYLRVNFDVQMPPWRYERTGAYKRDSKLKQMGRMPIHARVLLVLPKVVVQADVNEHNYGWRTKALVEGWRRGPIRENAK